MTAWAPIRLANRTAASAALLASLALIAGLAGCTEAPPAPPPPPVAEIPPPPPVLLPRSVVEKASVYETYIQRAAEISASYNDGAAVAASLKAGETYQIDQFQRGQTAYGAIVALQDPTFVSGLREFAKDPQRRSQIANMVVADPSYTASLKGADSAAGLVIAAFSDHGRKLLANGAKIRQAAYDVQHQSWSKADVPDRPGRLALAKSLSEETQNAIDENVVHLSKAAAGNEPMGLSAPPVTGPYTPLVARALAVAAMAALGEGGEEYSPQLNALLADSYEGSCLHMAKLNLYQCLAVAKPHYEDVFCLGQHVVSDTGQCIMKGSVVGYAPPLPVVTPTPASEVKTSTTKKAATKKKKAG